MTIDDHSRVKLKDARETDYINANFVECKLAQKKYILAQVMKLFSLSFYVVIL